jgi:hypothetical protein
MEKTIKADIVSDSNGTEGRVREQSNKSAHGLGDVGSRAS